MDAEDARQEERRTTIENIHGCGGGGHTGVWCVVVNFWDQMKEKEEIICAVTWIKSDF